MKYLKQLCRCCLNVELLYYPDKKYEINGKTITIAQMLKKCTDVDINDNISYPAKMCFKCITTIFEFYVFRLKCVNNQSLLHQICNFAESCKTSDCSLNEYDVNLQIIKDSLNSSIDRNEILIFVSSLLKSVQDDKEAAEFESQSIILSNGDNISPGQCVESVIVSVPAGVENDHSDYINQETNTVPTDYVDERIFESENNNNVSDAINIYDHNSVDHEQGVNVDNVDCAITQNENVAEATSMVNPHIPFDIKPSKIQQTLMLTRKCSVVLPIISTNYISLFNSQNKNKRRCSKRIISKAQRDCASKSCYVDCVKYSSYNQNGNYWFCKCGMKYRSKNVLLRHIKASYGPLCKDTDVYLKYEMEYNHNNKRNIKRESSISNDGSKSVLFAEPTVDLKLSNVSVDLKMEYNDFNLFSCDICGKRYQRKYYFILHKKTHNSNDADVNNREDDCNKYSSKLHPDDVIQDHLQNKCRECGDTLGSFEELESHVTENHKQLLCDKCPMTLTGTRRLSTHLIRNHTIKQGTKKSMSMDQRKKAKNWFKNTTEKLKHLCIICDEGFKTKKELMLHTCVHTNQKLFECQFEDCDKKFLSRGGYKYHTANHIKKQNGKRREAKFSESLELMDHSEQQRKSNHFIATEGTQNVHDTDTENMPYDCTMCSMFFSTEVSFKMHVYAHVV